MRITGKEKAFLGGLGAGITAFAGQLAATNGQINVKTLAWSVGAWVFTHLFVYYTTDTQITEQSLVNDAAALGAAVAASETPAASATPAAPPVDPTTPAPPAAPSA